MKPILTLITTLLLLLFACQNSYAEENIDGIATITELTADDISTPNDNGTSWDNAFANLTEEQRGNLIRNLDFNENLKMWETLKIDASGIENDLKKNSNAEFEFEWNLKGSSTKIGNIYEQTFDNYGKKNINLNVYLKENNEKKLITSRDISLFVYKSKTNLIFDTDINNDLLLRYKEKSLDEWVFIEEVLKTNETNIQKNNILHLITSQTDLNEDQWNYITIWWNKDFLFSVLSNINKEIESTNSEQILNIALLSPLSTDVLENYFRNFLSNKEWIDTILLLPESSRSQIWLNPENIISLENNLQKNGYEYLNINTTSQISEILFISKFINILSNKWFATSDIFLVILIPFLFTWLSFMKHLVGLSPVGSIIPIMLTLSLFQIWIIATLVLLGSIIILNLILSKITNKYTLLYTPKMSFIMIINIIVAIILINSLIQYNLLEVNMTDITFIILFVIICERLITVVLSKEFWEYKYNLLNTVSFAAVGYLIFSFSFIQTTILAYPEIILLLVPVNFIVGRFTWLRITEYFRFREVIKNIEE